MLLECKKCTKCGEFKPTMYFRKALKTKDGFSCHCTSCLKKDTPDVDGPYICIKNRVILGLYRFYFVQRRTKHGESIFHARFFNENGKVIASVSTKQTDLKRAIKATLLCYKNVPEGVLMLLESAVNLSRDIRRYHE